MRGVRDEPGAAFRVEETAVTEAIGFDLFQLHADPYRLDAGRRGTPLDLLSLQIRERVDARFVEVLARSTDLFKIERLSRQLWEFSEQIRLQRLSSAAGAGANG